MSMYLRILRKEGYNQLEMDKLFICLVRDHAGGGAGGVAGGGGGGFFAPPPPPRLFRIGYQDLSLTAQIRFSNLTILDTQLLPKSL